MYVQILEWEGNFLGCGKASSLSASLTSAPREGRDDSKTKDRVGRWWIAWKRDARCFGCHDAQQHCECCSLVSKEESRGLLQGCTESGFSSSSLFPQGELLDKSGFYFPPIPICFVLSSVVSLALQVCSSIWNTVFNVGVNSYFGDFIHEAVPTLSVSGVLC